MNEDLNNVTVETPDGNYPDTELVELKQNLEHI